MAVRTLPSLKSRTLPLSSPAVQLETLARLPLARDFDAALADAGVAPLRSARITTMQLNLGKLCNQACRHCHVDAGPDRRETMSRETLEQCLDALARTSIENVDITGGAPELHPDFRWLVGEVTKLGRHVMDRCNLTVLESPSARDLPELFAAHEVELVCSLPHYREAQTDRQRGEGVFARSIDALRQLNAVGYGRGGALRLVLVTNPVGAFLPPAQASLEREWKREMERLHGVQFDALYTITNMPISRYLEWLIDSDNLGAYMERLVTLFNPAAAAGVMCRSMISVAWDGALHDCDFNQMLELPVETTAPQHVADFALDALEGRAIVTGRHCFGCTAGAGSSCGGAVA